MAYVVTGAGRRSVPACLDWASPLTMGGLLARGRLLMPQRRGNDSRRRWRLLIGDALASVLPYHLDQRPGGVVATALASLAAPVWGRRRGSTDGVTRRTTVTVVDAGGVVNEITLTYG